MIGSRRSDLDPMDPPLPIASEELQDQAPASFSQASQRQGRDLCCLYRIRIRSAAPLPPWYGDFFQRIPEDPVSTSRGPLLPEGSSEPSADNRRSSSPPSEVCCQPGASKELLGEEDNDAYKRRISREEKEVSKVRELCSSSSFSLRDPESNSPPLAAVSSPHSTAFASSSFSEKWRARELLREKKLRRAALLIEEAEVQCCSERSIQVKFLSQSRFSRVTLFPCEPEMNEEFEIDDDLE